MSATPGWDTVEPSPSADFDRELRPYLLANDAEAGAHLGDVLQRVAAPVAWDVVRGQLRGVDRSDLDDVHAGVLLALATHLRGVRRPADADGAAPIRDLTGYVAMVAHNACHAFLRTRFPHRAHLRSRVRYVLTRDAGLALWEGGRREWLCGSAAQRGSARHVGAGARLVELGRQVAGGDSLPELVRSLLRQLPGPARFDDLVDAVAAIQGIEDAERRPREDEPEPRQDPPDPGPSPEAALAQRDFLGALWSEIRLLPAGQRVALLLNLRDAEGRGMIGLFPLTDTATVGELADAMGMTEERLRGIWDDLPREDAWIADWLGVTPRQVINLRKCARERLARRMKKRDAW
jgi:hypothetical protein